ncbi:MAG: hypothetical protein GWO40_04495 [Gammaproteobacteria bacterium]|nr:hypothetical protein [Gammaproteobacteria bacterium]NIU03547.1 hypothetical protein [Gammaproteobacteria bacterium]NIX84821.1 hypothetical protein [Gammaproteobacteria bacterium]
MSGCRRCTMAWVLLALVCAPAVAAAVEHEAVPGSMVPRAKGAETAVLWQPGDPGERLFLRGRVLGSDGRPLAGAVVNLWHADGTGRYRETRYRTRLETAKDGTFNVATVLPGQYWGVKHIHVVVDHHDYPRLDKRIVFKGDPNLNQTGGRDQAILLEEVHKDGEKVLVGGVELVLGAKVGN